MTEKRDITAFLFGGGGEMLKPIVNAESVTVTAEYLHAADFRDVRKLVLTVIAVSADINHTLVGVKSADIVKFVFAVAEVNEDIKIDLIHNGFERLIVFMRIGNDKNFHN